MTTGELMRKIEPMIEEIYNDRFIQGLINGNIDKESIIHYLQADALYLDEFANLYAMLISKANSKDKVKYLLGQMDFLLDGEIEAHDILSRAVGIPYQEIIKNGEWYPAADHYIKHMYFNAYSRENIAFTLSAMAPCPYVYRRIAEMAMERNAFKPDHPYKKWFEFYAVDMDDTLEVMLKIIDEEAEKLSVDDIMKLKKNFIESTEHEKRFFNMAVNKERWMEADVDA